MRKLECKGTCDEYGDPLPNGVARLRVECRWRRSGELFVIVLDRDEAEMLKRELDAGLLAIDGNRLAARKLK